MRRKWVVDSISELQLRGAFQEPLIIMYLRIHWRLSIILKTNSWSVWSNVFSYEKVYIFWTFIQYTIHWDKTQMLKKFSLDKTNVTKTALFITVLLLIFNSYTSWSTYFIYLKLCVEFFYFDSVSFLSNFFLTKSMDFLTLKLHNSFQNKNKRKATQASCSQTSDI